MKKYYLFLFLLICISVSSNATVIDNRACFVASKNRQVLKINDEKSFLKLCLDKKCLKEESFKVRTGTYSGVTCPLNIKYGNNKYMQFIVTLDDGKELKSPIIEQKVAYYKLHVKGKKLKPEEFPPGYLTKTIRKGDLEYPERKKTLYDSLMLDSLPAEEREPLEKREKEIIKKKELDRRRFIKWEKKYKDDSVCFGISPKSKSLKGHFFNPQATYIRYCIDEKCTFYHERNNNYHIFFANDIICFDGDKFRDQNSVSWQDADYGVPKTYSHYIFYFAFKVYNKDIFFLEQLDYDESNPDKFYAMPMEYKKYNNFYKITFDENGTAKTKRYSSKYIKCATSFSSECKKKNPLYKEILRERKQIDKKRFKIWKKEYKQTSIL